MFDTFSLCFISAFEHHLIIVTSVLICPLGFLTIGHYCESVIISKHLSHFFVVFLIVII